PPPSALILPELPEPEPVSSRPVFFKDEGWADCPIFRRQAVGRGVTLRGPLIIEEVDSTTLVLSGQTVRTHRSGSLIVSDETDVATALASAARLESLDG